MSAILIQTPCSGLHDSLAEATEAPLFLNPEVLYNKDFGLEVLLQ